MGRLQLKLFLALVVVALATATLLGAFGRTVGRSGVQEVLEIEDEHSARSESALALQVARRLEALLGREGDLSGAALLLEEASSETMGLGLFDPAGEVIAVVGLDGDALAVRPTEGGDGVVVEAKTVVDGRLELLQVRGGVPVRDANGEVRAFLLPFSPLAGRAAERRAVLGALDRHLLGGAAVVVVLAVLFSIGMARVVVRPVEELAAAVRGVGSGALDRRVTVRGRDEIARLGHAFNEMVSRLERSEALRRQMVSDVAHELRTPLAALRVQLEALEDGLLSPDPETLASLVSAVVHLGELVDDLQELVHADAGTLRLEPTEVELRPAVEAASRVYAAGDPAAAERLQIDVEPGLAVRADARRLRQILENLFDNARRHAPAAALEVVARRTEDEVTLVFRDDGPGIAPEHLAHLFERFYRADPSRSRATGGRGLGLAITRALVELHGGRINARSRPGEGTEVELVLPAESAQRVSS